MAYYIAEGGLTRSTPAFTNVDPELIADFRGIISSRFPELQIRQRKITYFASTGRKGGRSNPITTWLRGLGLMGKHADAKAFPSEAWRWDRGILAEFLSTLFACDGTIYNMAGFPRIEFTVASQQLAEDVHHALTRFGIVAKLWRKTERSWRVEITEPKSVWRYQMEIGWKGEKGWRFAVPGEEPARRSNLGHIPTSVWGEVKSAATARSTSRATCWERFESAEKTSNRR